MAILTQPKNAVIKQYHKLFELDDDKDVLEGIAEKALARKTGARGLRSIIETLLLDSMYNVTNLKKLHVHISKDVMPSRFKIPKLLVLQAYKLIKANAGAAEVDQQTIKDFEENLKKNLYKIWNRMSSASYMPQPVKAAIAIPKRNGDKRMLGEECLQ